MTEKTTLTTLNRMKQQQQPITMLTCYDAPTAALLQDAGIDSLLVGDSLAQTILGHDSTLPATMDLMVAFTAAVRRGAPNVFLMGDMPFLSYQTTPADAVRNAGRLLVEAGCDAVKLEVDHRHRDTVAALAAAGIPAVAHLGYLPQSTLQADKIVGTRTVARACQLVQDARTLTEAGAVMLLLECVTVTAAQTVTQQSPVPVISCGSGPYCDGQVLVIQEVMGLPAASAARFCKRYANLGPELGRAAGAYIADVRARTFPDDEHSYHMKPPDQQNFLRKMKP